MAKWNKPPSELTAQIITDLRTVVQASFFELARRIITRTPVLTGQLANNWRAALNSQSIDFKPGGAAAATDSYISVKTAMDAYVLGDSIFFGNKTPYAGVIEYEGHSRLKAPDGMLRISIAEWDQIVSTASKHVKSGAKP